MLIISTNTGLLEGIARKLYMRPKAVMLHMLVIPLQHKSSAPRITGESLYNSIMNGNKSTIPALNCSDSGLPMAITSADKAELLSTQFAKNSCLDDSGVTPPPLAQRTQEAVPSPSISVKRVKHIIKCLDSSKSSGSDGILMIVFKKLSPDLSPILS